MRRIELPDGTYINPADISKVESERQFLSTKYSVRFYSDKRRKLGAIYGLTRSQADSEKQRYKIQLEELHTDVSAYREGYEAGIANGTKSGDDTGYEEGYRKGFAGGSETGRQSGYSTGLEAGRSEGYQTGRNDGFNQGRWAGVGSVLHQLRRDRDHLVREVRSGMYANENRRQSIVSVINFANRVIELFAPSNPDPEPASPEPECDESERGQDEYDCRPCWPPIQECLLRKINQLKLSDSAANCLRDDNIIYIGDLVQKSEAEMRRTPNLTAKLLNEIKTALATVGVSFGMEISNWPPENLEQLSNLLDEAY